MKISYNAYNINNLNYKFDNKSIKNEKLDETYLFNIKSTTLSINEKEATAVADLKIMIDTKVNNDKDKFRTISFDFICMFNIEDYETMKDSEIQQFVVDHGMASAFSSLKDAILKITSIDYQPRLIVDIPKFPIDLQRMPNSVDKESDE